MESSTPDLLKLITTDFFKKNVADGALQLSPIKVNDDYKKKWNESLNNFVCLTKNGELISNSLYRVGGFGGNIKNNYFMLLKYFEAYYDDVITKEVSKKPHLEGRWCILNKEGVEKACFPKFETPYIKADSRIYSVRSKYYDIETGAFYCEADSYMDSSDYIFLSNKYDKDLSRRGVWQINKKTGSVQVFP